MLRESTVRSWYVPKTFQLTDKWGGEVEGRGGLQLYEGLH